MKSIGHPLLGDELYGGPMNLIQRQALHSYYVILKNPIEDKEIEVYAKLPKDMERLK
jgi:23S rRNA pseudouridine1911/1915/1917 synthase